MPPSHSIASGPDPQKPPFPWAANWPEITSPAVREAFAQVDRSRFVPQELRDQSEKDAPLPIGEGQTISQPFVVALMAQALDLHPGDRVLEIGTGSGYQTAILCELVRTAGMGQGENVFSIERLASLQREAERALHGTGYEPHLTVGDGAAGWPEHAPYDAIVASAAAAYVPRSLYDQLAPGGRLVIPVGPQGDEQWLWLIRRTARGLHHESLGPVRFVPLISPLLDDPSNRLVLI